ncbi:MAG: hypothetical protein ABI698_01235 [bacterium]
MSQQTSLTPRVAYITIGLVLILCSSILVSSGKRLQDSDNPRDKIVELSSPSDAPVSVIGLKVSGKQREAGTKFDDDENWLSRLSLRISNKTNKPIVGIQMDLFFPETKATGNMMAFPFWFGSDPLVNPQAVTERKRLDIADAVDVPFTESSYLALKRFVERRHPMRDIHQVRLQINTIYFEDGSIWSYGSWVQRDRSNPRRLIPIDR